MRQANDEGHGIALPPEAFERGDDAPDALFYLAPRFVEHIDEFAIEEVRGLYRRHPPAGAEILDLMSSWVSHLPDEVSYGRVVGVGMNDAELAGNPRLDAYVVHDLNADPRLPFEDRSFDAAAICVSIQYLTDPVAVLGDLARVVRPSGKAVVTFSNRCFPTKAVAVSAGARRPRPSGARRPLLRGGGVAADRDGHLAVGRRPAVRGRRGITVIRRRALFALASAGLGPATRSPSPLSPAASNTSSLPATRSTFPSASGLSSCATRSRLKAAAACASAPIRTRSSDPRAPSWHSFA